MNQFKLWIHFSPAGFQGNQGLCVCATNLLPWTALSFSVPNQHMPSQTRAEGESSSAALAALVLQPFVQFSNRKIQEQGGLNDLLCVCVCEKLAIGRAG